MSGYELRRLDEEEFLDVMFRLPSYAFSSSPPFPDKSVRLEALKKRLGTPCFAIFENGKAVATAAGALMNQNVRGVVFKMSGIFWVVTEPQARRKGYCKELMKRVFADARDDGRTVSSLYPFRESFYERMGYVTFPQTKAVKFAPETLLPVMNRPLEGAVERTLLTDELGSFNAYLQSLQKRTHGFSLFEQIDFYLTMASRYWLATARINGEVRGVMAYFLQGDHPTKFTMHVGRFYYDSSEAKHLLLDWIARHVDQAEKVELVLPAYETPETWISDLNAQIETHFTAPMGRVLDIQSLQGIQTGPGSFSAKIIDPMCPWNQHNWRFETDRGMLSIHPAQHADFEMTIQGLSALAFGSHAYDDFTFRGWGNPTPKSILEMKNMFPRMSPFLHEYF